MKIIYRATKNSDNIEGKGYTITIGYFDKKEDALEAAKGRGVWVGDGDVEEIKVFDSLVDYENDKIETAKQKALNKLTSEEKRILGLLF